MTPKVTIPCETTDHGIPCPNMANWIVTANAFVKTHRCCDRCKGKWETKRITIEDNGGGKIVFVALFSMEPET